MDPLCPGGRPRYASRDDKRKAEHKRRGPRVSYSWGWVSALCVKKLIEIVLCILHPIAVVLIWIDLLGRTDMALVPRLTWAIAALVPIVPFVYVLTGHDFV